MRWMLLVDTCGTTGEVALAEFSRLEAGTKPRMVSRRMLPGRSTQERLMTAIEELLAERGLRQIDLQVLAIVTGPGSFTGVRIGMAAVKGLAESLDLPVVAVSRLAVLVSQAPSMGTVQAWMDAGRGDVFIGRYCEGKCLSESMMHSSAAVADLEAGDIVIAMEGLPAGLYPELHYVSEPNLNAVLPLAAFAVEAHSFADVALLDANYLRVPDAELHRRAAVERQTRG